MGNHGKAREKGNEMCIRDRIQIVLGIGLLQIILPAAVTMIFYKLCARAGWIKAGDMKLDL